MNIHSGDGDCFITTADAFSVRYRLYQTESILYEGTPLCAFDVVKKQLEQSIADGNLREVRRVELGYVAWPNPNDPETFNLIPMWMAHVRWLDRAHHEIEASFLKDPQTADEIYTENFYFNAQTGEQIDRWRTDSERCIPLDFENR